MKQNLAVIVLVLLQQGVAMAEGIFVHSYNSTSERYAILDESTEVAFLYLSKPGAQQPEKDAIAYMKIEPPTKVDWKEQAKLGLPPLLSSEMASEHAVIKETNENDFSFLWSSDGNSAALLYKDNPISFVSKNLNIGYSKAVSKENKLTNPWDQKQYELLFAQ